MPTDQEIAQLAEDRYRDNDILIEVRPWVKRVDGGAWVEARVWVPLSSKFGQLDCLRLWNDQYGWCCASPDGHACPHYKLGSICTFDKDAEREWKGIVHGG